VVYGRNLAEVQSISKYNYYIPVVSYQMVSAIPYSKSGIIIDLQVYEGCNIVLQSTGTTP
jgi:hypothetical protein